MASSRLWYRVFNETMSKHYPHLQYRSLLADAAAMIMLKNPRELNGVLVMDNLFGDVLSDEASGIVGSLGLSPSASLCGLEGTSVGLCGFRDCWLTSLVVFSDVLDPDEPVHGSAPDIAGQGIANPIAYIHSAAMLVRYTFNLPEHAKAIEKAVERAFDELGLMTKDLGGNTGTEEMGGAVLKLLHEELAKLK
jgi:3-isopropylmalate dehydrogenase